MNAFEQQIEKINQTMSGLIRDNAIIPQTDEWVKRLLTLQRQVLELKELTPFYLIQPML